MTSGASNDGPYYDEFTQGSQSCDNGEPDCFLQSEFVFKQQSLIVRHRRTATRIGLFEHDAGVVAIALIACFAARCRRRWTSSS